MHAETPYAENSQERLLRERDTLDLLLELGRVLDRHAELRDAVPPILAALEAKAGLRRGWLALRDAPGAPLRAHPDGFELRLGQDHAGRSYESGDTVSAQLDDGNTGYWVPVKAGAADGRLLGMLHALRPLTAPGNNADTQRNRDLALLKEAAALIAQAALLRERLASGTRPPAPHSPLRAEPEDTGGWHEVRPRIPGGSPFGGLVGTSDAMKELYALIERVAPTEATVLILGESGTGKELAAAELHRGSRRAAGPFIKVNCAALPESVIESELFGHEKGSFTGASALRRGRFELAHGGTVFLDEIGELSPQVQVKLLRVLQEREIERVGGGKPVPVDVRIIAATNRDLEAELRAGRFREDLYYRLAVFPLRMPPLRSRRSDILLLADWFVEKYAARNGKEVRRISSPAIDLLASYHWPGNVRELENSIERAVILSTDKVIHAWHLPPSLQSAESTRTAPGSTLEAALSRLEKELIVEALKMHKGNMAAAAKRLGITERQMGLRVRYYALDWRSYRRERLR